MTKCGLKNVDRGRIIVAESCDIYISYGTILFRVWRFPQATRQKGKEGGYAIEFFPYIQRSASLDPASLMVEHKL